MTAAARWRQAKPARSPSPPPAPPSPPAPARRLNRSHLASSAPGALVHQRDASSPTATLIAKPAGPGGSLSLMARDTLESTAAGGIVLCRALSALSSLSRAPLSCYPLRIEARSMADGVRRALNLLLAMAVGVNEDASRSKGRGRREAERTRRPLCVRARAMLLRSCGRADERVLSSMSAMWVWSVMSSRPRSTRSPLSGRRRRRRRRGGEGGRLALARQGGVKTRSSLLNLCAPTTPTPLSIALTTPSPTLRARAHSPTRPPNPPQKNKKRGARWPLRRRRPRRQPWPRPRRAPRRRRGRPPRSRLRTGRRPGGSPCGARRPWQTTTP